MYTIIKKTLKLYKNEKNLKYVRKHHSQFVTYYFGEELHLFSVSLLSLHTRSCSTYFFLILDFFSGPLRAKYFSYLSRRSLVSPTVQSDLLATKKRKL